MMFSKRFERFVVEDIKDRDGIMPAEVIRLWESIERHRAAIARQLAIFEGWLEISPALDKDWCEFTEIGGVKVSSNLLMKSYWSEVASGAVALCRMAQRPRTWHPSVVSKWFEPGSPR
jgi:hypothetical protein